MERYVNQRLARHIRTYGFDSDYSDHDDLTLETLLEFPMEDWDWSSVLFHSRCTLKWILEFVNKSWPWHDLHLNDHFQVTWIHHLYDKPLDWHSLSRIDNIHRIAVQYPYKEWDWRALSLNVPIDILVSNPYLPWDWSTATILGNITVKEMCQYPTLPWDVPNLLFTDVTEDEIQYFTIFRDRFDENHWVDFSRHATWDIVIEHMGFPWVFENIRFNRILGESDFEKIQNIGYTKFNWSKLSRWVDCDVLLKYNYYPWRWDILHLNSSLELRHLPMVHEMCWTQVACEPIETIIRRWHSACVIQRQWRRCVTDPEYQVCRTLIHKFLGELEEYINGR